MGKETPVGGGVAYFGHSTDDDADFRAAMNLLTSSGHIVITKSTTGINVKYDWMDTGKWIVNLNATDGFAYSVYESDTNDVFGSFISVTTSFSSPQYGAYGCSALWGGRGAAGINTNTGRLSIAILKTTDILGSGEQRQYLVFNDSNLWCGYPDSAPLTIHRGSDDILTNINYVDTKYKFTVLAPIATRSWGSGVATNARWPIYSDSSPALGAYTIGGYNFRAVGYTGSGIIFLRNGTSSSG